MIYLGVEYGTKFVLENPLLIPEPTGKINRVVDPIFTNSNLANFWAANNYSAFTLAPNMALPMGETGSAMAFSVSALQTGYIQTKNLITVGVERVDYGFWVRGAKGQVVTLESVSYKTGETSPVGATTNVTLTEPEGTWQWIAATRTMPAETVAARFRVKQTGAEPSGSGLFIWGGMVTTGRSSLIAASEYFPTKAQLKTKEAQWTGAESESTTGLYIAVTRASFNDPTDPDYIGILDPESSGLDSPEIREDSNDRVESDGAIFGDFFSGKRPIVLQGVVRATTQAQRNERVGKLRAASNAKTADATLWWEDVAGGKVFVNVRRQQPLRVTKGWNKEFQLAIVSADSRILSYGLKSVSAEGITNSSQEKAPTAASQYSLGGGSLVWATPTNIKLNDSTAATVVMNNSAFSQFLYGATYGFTIPSTAAITGVEVIPKWKASVAANIRPYRAYINRNVASLSVMTEDILAGNIGSKLLYPGTSVPAAYESKVIGGTTDTWSYQKYLTPSIINGANFGAGFFFNAESATPTLSVDYLPIKVSYAEPIKVVVPNEGNAPAPAIIKVKGPLENFYVLNQNTGEILTYTGKLESGKELWFDTESITVKELGTGITEPINRFSNVGLPNDWIKIWPGSNTILVAGLGGSAATKLTVEYRNAWE